MGIYMERVTFKGSRNRRNAKNACMGDMRIEKSGWNEANANYKATFCQFTLQGRTVFRQLGSLGVALGFPFSPFRPQRVGTRFQVSKPTLRRFNFVAELG